jgi:hypothetical protein
MLSDTMTIRPLDRAAVFYETEGCARPALYVFFAKRQRERGRSIEYGTNLRDDVLMCSAYCHEHAVQSAAQAGVSLPLLERRYAHAGG